MKVRGKKEKEMGGKEEWKTQKRGKEDREDEGNSKDDKLMKNGKK